MKRYSLGGGRTRGALIAFRTTADIKKKAQQLAKNNRMGMSEYMEFLLLKQIEKK